MARRHLKTYGPGFEWNGRTIVDITYEDGTRPSFENSKNGKFLLHWSDGAITDSSVIPTDENRQRILEGKEPFGTETNPYKEGW